MVNMSIPHDPCYRCGATERATQWFVYHHGASRRVCADCWDTRAEWRQAGHVWLYDSGDPSVGINPGYYCEDDRCEVQPTAAELDDLERPHLDGLAGVP